MAGRLAAPGPVVAGLTPIQARVHNLVVEHPGLTIVETSRLLGCTHATATYHLNLLLQRGFIACQRDGREVRHFTSGGPRQPTMYLQALCRDPRREALARHVAAQKAPMTLNELARQLGEPFGFVKRTMTQLQSEGLARVERQRFRYMVMPSPTLRDIFAMSAPAEPQAMVAVSLAPAI